MAAYYNEIDPNAAAWLRALIAERILPDGDVDERSILDVTPPEIRKYSSCHFFAGIGGWPYALRLAGVADDERTWTGSCPCQPFSVAGFDGGFDDERHLWPEFFRLIRECRPERVFGEQVASPAGRSWFDLVSADLEGIDYAVGAADLSAASVGAPHIRQRLYWVANAASSGRDERARRNRGSDRRPAAESGRLRDAGGMADADGRNAGPEGLQRSREHGQRPQDARTGGLGEPGRAGLEGLARNGDHGHEPGRLDALAGGSVTAPGRGGPAGTTHGGWAAPDWLRCTDGKWRPVEPGTFPLAHGIPGRVGRLRGYGNAIVPELAAEFIRAAIDAINDTPNMAR